MYSIVLLVHSIVRWLVVIAGVVAAVHAWRASSWRGPARASAAGLFFVIFFDIQLLLGIILYVFLSPTTTNAIYHSGAVMANNVVRFWLIEHPFGMIVALILAHIGRAKSRGAIEDQRERRVGAMYYTIAILIVLITAPWPFMPYGRPLI